MSASDELVLDPFAALLSGKQERKAWISPQRFKAVQRIRSDLEQLVGVEQQSIATVVSTSHADIDSHLRSTQSLKRKLNEASGAVQQLETGLSTASSRSIDPLVDLLHKRSALARGQAVASLRHTAYAAISERTRRLLHLEREIVQGKGASLEVADALLADGQAATAPGGSGAEPNGQLGRVVQRARAWQALDRRKAHLQAVLSAQLQDAFDRAITLADGLASPRIRIDGEIKLELPPNSGLSPQPGSTEMRPGRFTDLLHAMDRLGILSPALEGLQRKVMTRLVEPIVLAETENTPSSAASVVAGLKAVLQAIVDPLSGPTGQLKSVSAFITGLHIACLRLIVDAYLVRIMPGPRPDEADADMLAALQSWTTAIQFVQDFERDLAQHAPASDPATLQWDASGAAPYGLVARFAADRGGALWAAAQKQSILERARALICGGWQGWAEEIIELPVDAPAPAAEDPMEKAQEEGLMRAHGAADKAVDQPEQAAGDESADGWAFDGDWENTNKPLPASADSDTVAAPTQAEESGWSFDDDIEGPPATPAPQSIATPSKPVRQAKRIGKNKSKPSGDPAQEEKAETPTDMPSSSVGSLPIPRPDADQSSAPLLDGDHWQDMPPETVQPSSVASLIPTPPAEKCAVSKACAALMVEVKCSLRISQSMKNSELPTAFDGVAAAVESTASEVLDLYRALMPVVHAKEVEDIPSLGIQFANDCGELARQTSRLRKQDGWDVRHVESRLVSLGQTVVDKQMATQNETLLECLNGAKGFADTTLDSQFEKDKRVVGQAVHQLQVLHRQWKPVMTESTCLRSSGTLVHALVNKLTSDILALEDITALESERLDALCQLIYPLEELFTSHQGSRVVEHVPHWLKFCYLSEILTGSLVDITYLLDNGALIDFTSMELVHLVAALFSDTPKRATIIEKIWARDAEATTVS